MILTKGLHLTTFSAANFIVCRSVFFANSLMAIAVHLSTRRQITVCPVPGMNGAPSSLRHRFFFAAEEALVSARAGGVRCIFGGEETVSSLLCLALPCRAAVGVNFVRDTLNASYDGGCI